MSFVSTRTHNLTYTSRFYNGGVREKVFLTKACLKLIGHNQLLDLQGALSFAMEIRPRFYMTDSDSV